MTPLESDARAFASWAHGSIDQRRKYTLDPYIVHPAEVAALVHAVPQSTPTMRAAAWLHDVLDDVPQVTDALLLARFGADVTGLVLELSDSRVPQSGNRAQRKAALLAHHLSMSTEAKVIRLADIVSNTNGIDRMAQEDPLFAKVYLLEKFRLLAVLTGVADGLWLQASTNVQRGAARLHLTLQ